MLTVTVSVLFSEFLEIFLNSFSVAECNLLCKIQTSSEFGKWYGARFRTEYMTPKMDVRTLKVPWLSEISFWYLLFYMLTIKHRNQGSLIISVIALSRSYHCTHHCSLLQGPFIHSLFKPYWDAVNNLPLCLNISEAGVEISIVCPFLFALLEYLQLCLDRVYGHLCHYLPSTGHHSVYFVLQSILQPIHKR